MIKTDELTIGLEFSNVFTDLPEYFTEINQRKIDKFIQKWALLEKSYQAVEDALACETFTDDEIAGYALWRTVIYYSANTPSVSKLKRKIFTAVLERFTKYYRTLAGRKS